MACGILMTVAVVAMTMAVAVSGHYFRRGGKGDCDKVFFPGSKYRYLQRGHYGKFQFYDCTRGTMFDPRYCKCVPEGYGGPEQGIYGGVYIGVFPKAISSGSKGYGKGYDGSGKAYGGGSTGLQGGYTGLQGGYTGPQGGYTDPQGGYTGPQSGYTGPQGGYTGLQGGYGGTNKGYDNGYDKNYNAGYNQGYDNGNKGYDNKGYGAGNTGYTGGYGTGKVNSAGPLCNKAPEPGFPNKYRVYDSHGAFRVYACEKGTAYSQQRCKCIATGW